MILIIDNYDSFTYNLYQQVGEVVQRLNSSVTDDSVTDSDKDSVIGPDKNSVPNNVLEEIKVIRNDELTLSQIKDLNPDRIIISPGPGNPTNERDFGVCRSVIKELGDKIPILGVCLGHQGIFSTFGGEIIHEEPVHGKVSQVLHEETGIFNGVSNPLDAARYHSLICDPGTVPSEIKVTAKTDQGIIMALEHKNYPIFGLQFHPESIGTEEGHIIIQNFLEINHESH